MMKTDIKKGFFAKLQLTRSESIYRLLSKSSQPLSLYGEDVLNIREYLYHFATDIKETRKRRSKVKKLFFNTLGTSISFIFSGF